MDIILIKFGKLKACYTKESLNAAVVKAAREIINFEVCTAVDTKNGCKYPSVDHEKMKILLEGMYKFTVEFTKLGKAKLLYPETISIAINAVVGLYGYNHLIEVMKEVY